MASSKKKTTSKKTMSKKTMSKKVPAKKAGVEKLTKRISADKTRAPKSSAPQSKAEKAVRGKKAIEELTERTITATVTLSGSPEELKACVEEIVEAAKKVLEKELRKQIKQA